MLNVNIYYTFLLTKKVFSSQLLNFLSFVMFSVSELSQKKFLSSDVSHIYSTLEGNFKSRTCN